MTSHIEHVSSVDELVERLVRFLGFTPEQKKSSGLSAGPQGMCEIGAELFGKFCDDFPKNSQFFTHIALEPQHGGCEKCRTAFYKHLWLITD